MEHYQNVLIPLDCLLDTRFGLLLQKFPERTSKVDLSEYYHRDHKRVWDIFGVNRKKWLHEWDRRTTQVLKFSRPTELYYALNQILVAAAYNGIASPIHHKLHVFVNTYPYILTAQEKMDIEEAIVEFLPTYTDCTLVRHRPENLTPSFIKSVYQSVFMLDLVEWLSQHHKALAEDKIPAVTVFYPSWMDDDSKEVREALENAGMNPYTTLRQYLSEHVAAETVDGNLFTLPLQNHP